MTAPTLDPGQSYQRCFLGIALPNELLSDFAYLQEKLVQADPQLQLTDPQTPHIVLLFLGSKQGNELEALIPTLDKILKSESRTSVYAHGLGTFGNRYRQVIYLKVVAEKPLVDLEQKLQSKLLGLSPKVAGEYIPHLTVARLAAGEAIKPELSELLDQVNWQFFADEVALYGATATETGPKQAKLHSWSLTG